MTGRLRRIHRGVYSPSPGRLPPFAPVAAAILACGPDAAASHRSGAWVRGLGYDGRRLVDVTAGSLTGLRHGSVITHSAARLRPEDISIEDGIPVTSVARTLLDCAPQVGRRGTEKMIAEAERLGTFDLGGVEDLIEHLPGHPGAATLRVAVADAATTRGETASPAEDALLAALRRVGLSGFELNATIALDDGSFAHPDFLWRAECLVVEVDPRGTHDRTATYRSDRRRDRILKRTANLDTMRFSDVDLADPRACALEVVDRLALQRHNLRTVGVRKL